MDSFTLNSVSVLDSTINSDESFFSVVLLKQFQVNDVHILRCMPNTLDGQDTSFITLSSLDINNSYNSSLNGLIYENSSLNVVNLLKLANSYSSLKTLKFTNLTYKNTEISTEKSLIKLNQLHSSSQVEFFFEDLTFSNIKFTTIGYLLKLDHHLPANLTLKNCVFSKISNGIILITNPRKNDKDIFTHVDMYNVTVDNVQQSKSSFILVREEAKLSISNSNFTNVSALASGSVINGGSSKTETVIENSLFQNNTAQKGGVFYVSDQSSILCRNCILTNNYAITSGVIEVTLGGYFEFYSSHIYTNYANSEPITLILDSAEQSIVNNCSIYGNEALSKTQISEEFLTCSKLCFVNEEYKTYSNANFGSTIIDIAETQLFQVISGSLLVLNKTKIYDQSVIMNSFVSTISFEDSLIENITFGRTSIQSVSTSLTLNRMTIRNLNNTAETDFILVMLDSRFMVSDLNYSSSNSRLFKMRASSIDISDINFDTIIRAKSLVAVTGCYNSSINALSSSNSRVTDQYLLTIDSSENVTLTKINIKNSQTAVMHISSSNMIKLEGINNIQNCSQAISISSSTIDHIKDSTFDGNGAPELHSGAAIRIIDSALSIQNSSFLRNTADSGAAVSFTCTSINLCSLRIDDCQFRENNAIEKGGAIYYDYVRPTFGSSIIFDNNSAQYGKNIASYAVKITFANDSAALLDLHEVGSGIPYPETLKFAIRDYDNQVMVLDSQDYILMSPTNPNTTEIKGFNSAPLRNGIASFDNLAVIAKQGSQGIQISATSNTINQNKIQKIFGTVISTDQITTNVRYCQPGESIKGSICEECSAGTYSLKWNSKICQQCMDDATCEGGIKISVNPGFWRKNLNSTNILKCINEDACEGGFSNDDANPTKCATGYTGELCSKCAITQDFKYQQVSESLCQKCPNPVINLIRVFLIGLTVFLFFMVIISVNVRKTSESSVSILLRIFTNYAHILTTAISFSANQPDLITGALLPIRNIGDSSTAFVSFDCFIKDSEIKGPFPSTILFKLFLLIFLPLLVFALVAIVWLIVYCIRRSWIPNILSCLIISFISVVFLMHPKLAQSGIDIFRCIQVDEGLFKVRIDSDIECYSTSHIKWCLILGVPILVFWVTLLPIIALFLMYRNATEEKENSKVHKYFLIFYQGLKPKHFYWEFVNSARKIMILIAFLMPETLSILFSLTVLIGTWRLQEYLQPYKDHENNQLEILGVNCAIITLCCGMAYNSEGNNAGLDRLLMVVMMVINLIFICRWAFRMISIFSTKYSFCKKISALFSKLSSSSDGKEQNTKSENKLKVHKKLIKSSQKKRRIKGLRNKMKTRKGNKKNAKIKKFKVDAKRMELQNSSQRSKMRMMFSERLANGLSENRLMGNSENIRRKIIEEEKAKSIYSEVDHIIHSRTNQISIIKEAEKKEGDQCDIFIPSNIGNDKDNFQEFSERFESSIPRKYGKFEK
ncbi:unnamed protein product [Moneuplotes crassus]|uniref:Uncharacterized protein n=1 Tax=Euplotes crassus TaxID=5936 RepID=A0AAD1UME9_EUPCR|nr:unnamed protein product [Moneuplotes crassus]